MPLRSSLKKLLSYYRSTRSDGATLGLKSSPKASTACSTWTPTKEVHGTLYGVALYSAIREAVNISYFLLLTSYSGRRRTLPSTRPSGWQLTYLTSYFLLWKEADVAVYSAIREAVNISYFLLLTSYSGRRRTLPSTRPSGRQLTYLTSYFLLLTLEGGGRCRLLGHPGGS